MAVEEQTEHPINTLYMYSGYKTRIGQRLIIADRTVSKLGFWLKGYGSPSGNITYTIRRVSNDSLICSKVLGDASGISLDPTYYEVEFDTPETINEEVRISAEFSGGNSSNAIANCIVGEDVKADEYLTRWDEAWDDPWGETYDCAYRYTYEALPVLAVTIQPMMVFLPTAKAHGTVTCLGETPCSQHGHCWATSPNPTIADDKTELGPKAETGTFESTLTGLLPSTTYYVRAYATDGAGTVYSSEISFIRYGPWRDEAALPFTPTGQIFLSPIIGDEVYVIDQGTNFYKYNLTTRVWTELTSPTYGSDAVSRSRFFRTLAISPDGTKLACCSEGKWSTYSNSAVYKTGGGRRVEIYNIAENNWSASKQTDFLFAGQWTATRSLVWEDNDTLWVWCIRHQRTATGWEIKCVKYVISTDTWTAYTNSFQDKATAENGINCGWSAAIKANKSVVYGGGTGISGYGYRYTKYTIEGDDYTHLPLSPLTNRFVHAYDRDKIWYYEADGTCQQGYVNVEDDSLHDDQFPESPDRDAGYGKYCGISDDLQRIIAHARSAAPELMSYKAKGMAGLNPALMEILGY